MKRFLCLSLTLVLAAGVWAEAALWQASVAAGVGTAGFSGDGGSALQAKLNYPAGLTSDSKGNLYIADGNNYRVRRIGVDGIITTFAGNTIIANGPGPVSGNGGPATQAEIGLPEAVAVDDSGNVYIRDNWNNVIRRVNSSGVISTFKGEWPKTDNKGYSLDPSGGLVKNRTGQVVARRWELDIDADTQDYPFLPMPAKFDPLGLAVSVDGFIYVSCSQTNRIYKLKSFPDSVGSVQQTFTVKPWKGDVPGSIVFLTVGPTPPPAVTQPPPPVGTVPPPLSADFSANNAAGIGRLEVRFALAVVPSNTPLKSLEWDFGDGKTSKEPSPAHLYEEPGEYTVTVRIVAEDGRVFIRTKDKFISVSSPPQPLLEPKIYLSRDSLDFRSDAVSQRKITVLNSGSAPLEISRIVINGPDSLDFSASPSSLNIGVERPGPQNNIGQVMVVFAPDTPGEKKAKLYLYHNGAGSPAVVVLSGISLAVGLKLTPDFNGDGRVDFSDLWPFVDVFGQKTKSATAKFDLDGDGEIGFGDFFIFANAFGQKV